MNKKGFTLIELLVVVVIIAILAAIALPKYFTVVQVSRIKSNLASLRPLGGAMDRYYLATGQNTNDMSLLDVQIPYNTATADGTFTQYNTDWGDFSLVGSSQRVRCHLKNYGEDLIFVIFNDRTKIPTAAANYPGTCMAYTEEAEEICSKLGPFITASSDSHGAFNQYGLDL